MQVFLLPRNDTPEERDTRLWRVRIALAGLSLDKGHRIEITESSAKRSDAQNNYLWGIVYPAVVAHGAPFDAFEAKELHEFFLGEHYGWRTLSAFGHQQTVPMRRSSRLTKTEFGEHVAFIQRQMAPLGCVIPDPEPAHENAA